MSTNVREVMHDLITKYNEVADLYETNVDANGGGDINEFAHLLQEATREVEETVINREDISYEEKELIFTTTTTLIDVIPDLVNDTKETVVHLNLINGRTILGKLWRAAANVVAVAAIFGGMAYLSGLTNCGPCFFSAIIGGVWIMGKMVITNDYLFGCTRRVQRCDSTGCFMACEIW